MEPKSSPDRWTRHPEAIFTKKCHAHEPKMIPKGSQHEAKLIKTYILEAPCFKGGYQVASRPPSRIDFGKVLGPFWDHARQFSNVFFCETWMHSSASCPNRPSKFFLCDIHAGTRWTLHRFFSTFFWTFFSELVIKETESNTQCGTRTLVNSSRRFIIWKCCA